MDNLKGVDPLTAIVSALKPLDSDERRRTVEAALHYLGEAAFTSTERHCTNERGHVGDYASDYPAAVATWLKQNDVTTDELDQTFHFNPDGTFDIHDVPGKSKKEKSLNTYILTGLGHYLATSSYEFDDATARGFCQSLGCYDNANHATHMKEYKGAEFTGDKNRGYTITKPGVRRGAALVKELASLAR